MCEILLQHSQQDGVGQHWKDTFVPTQIINDIVTVYLGCHR